MRRRIHTMSSKRVQPRVEAMEAKVVLSSISGHAGLIHAANLVATPRILHTEAVASVTVSGTYAITGSASRPIVSLSASEFHLPTLGKVKIIGTETTQGSLNNSAIVNTLIVSNGSNLYRMSITPGFFIWSGVRATTTHTYSVWPGGKNGSGKVELSLGSNSSFTLKFIPA